MFSYSDASVTSKVGRDTYLRPEEGPLPEEKARKREDRSGERKEGIAFLVTVVIFNYHYYSILIQLLFFNNFNIRSLAFPAFRRWKNLLRLFGVTVTRLFDPQVKFFSLVFLLDYNILFKKIFASINNTWV